MAPTENVSENGARGARRMEAKFRVACIDRKFEFTQFTELRYGVGDLGQRERPLPGLWLIEVGQMIQRVCCVTCFYIAIITTMSKNMQASYNKRILPFT